MSHTLVPAHRIFPRTFLGFFCICCRFPVIFLTPCQERAEASARKKRTSNGKWNRKLQIAIKKFATKLTDLRAELEAVGLEVHAMRATADGLNDELIKLTTEKAALKTKLTTRTTARSNTLAYKTKEAGRYREELHALEGGISSIIEIFRREREQFEIKPPCVIVISIPLIKGVE